MHIFQSSYIQNGIWVKIVGKTREGKRRVGKRRTNRKHYGTSNRILGRGELQLTYFLHLFRKIDCETPK